MEASISAYANPGRIEDRLDIPPREKANQELQATSQKKRRNINPEKLHANVHLRDLSGWNSASTQKSHFLAARILWHFPPPKAIYMFTKVQKFDRKLGPVSWSLRRLVPGRPRPIKVSTFSKALHPVCPWRNGKRMQEECKYWVQCACLVHLDYLEIRQKVCIAHLHDILHVICLTSRQFTRNFTITKNEIFYRPVPALIRAKKTSPTEMRQGFKDDSTKQETSQIVAMIREGYPPIFNN